MASRPIREVQGLNIVYKHINLNKEENGGLEPVKYFALENPEQVGTATTDHPWITSGVRPKSSTILKAEKNKLSVDPTVLTNLLPQST